MSLTLTFKIFKKIPRKNSNRKSILAKTARLQICTAFTCSNSAMKTPEKCMKSVQSLQNKI